MMEIIFFTTLFLYLFVVGSCIDYVDYDFFARLIVGKTYFETGDLLKYDFLSYSHTHPWWDHEWGASLIFYFIHEHFGDIGLLALKALTLFGTFFFFVQLIKLRRKVLHPDKKFPIFNFLFFFIALQPISNLVFSLRCHHFTFLFFAIWLYVLEKARLEKNYRVLWVLPLLMIVWSNIHGGCFMGLGITGLYVIGEFLAKRPFMPYVYTGLASFFLMLVNPYGYDYVKFLVVAATMSRPNIIEWQPPFSKYFFTKLIKFKIILLVFLGAVGYKLVSAYRGSSFEKKWDKIKDIWSKIDKTKFVLVLVTFVLTMKSMRFISYFVFVLIPFCYDDFYSVLPEKWKLSDKWNKRKEFILFGIALFAFVVNVAFRDLKYGNWHSIYPLSEIEYILENNIKGNVFVPFETGSYTAYKLFPNNFILQDGRYEEVYPTDLNDDYAKVISLGAVGWREKLDSIHHDAIISYKNYALYDNLKNHPDYYLIVESRTFALFLRKDVYHRLKKPLKTPTNSPDYYKATLWNTGIDWRKR